MKKFMFISIGFEKPTPEIMKQWQEWFGMLGDRIVEQGGLMNGKEISKAGTKDIPFDLDAPTGYLVVQAESHDEAMKLAGQNPFITSIQVFEIRQHG